MGSEKSGDRLLVSHLRLRRIIGLLGVALPVVLAVWGFALRGSVEVEDSLSNYYGLRTRDAFVGILFAFAWFLFAYEGYERKDDIAGNLAGLFALGVALFPTSGRPWEHAVHLSCAAALFFTLSYFAIFLFTKSGGAVSPEKNIRNRFYRGCGAIMLACVAGIGIYHLALKDTAIAALKPTFWLESLALWAFGASWFVKGETLWKDRNPKSEAQDA